MALAAEMEPKRRERRKTCTAVELTRRSSKDRDSELMKMQSSVKAVEEGGEDGEDDEADEADEEEEDGKST